ncbi:ATP-dependent RNA helicase CshB [Spiroplasma corruscae]|uniref:ATP-dependent RNA helicase CshB n=1 Tax=Spiroplasma corruscae TaxID=216934 RepID=A0A222ENN2_9MOLU|nr:DEAD/DEAH box helicase [Spiroplasma corruscae]ASP28116.1 ATP-dependent RNA helicase CshB [Spiroplasma corruscae]
MSFENFGLKKFLNDAIKEIGFKDPTSIQEKVIPLIKRRRSVIAQSHTGTGKTHAFLLPIINNIKPDEKKVQSLIITPTRELARQIWQNTRELIKNNPDISCALYVGGEEYDKQSAALINKQPQIVIGTPSRLKKLYEENFLQLTTSDNVIIDECDMIFELGFIDEVDFLISKINKQCNISLFSATLNNELKPFLKKYLRNSIYINNLENMTTNKNIEHILIWTKNKENKEVMRALTSTINPYVCLIFVNKKEEIKHLVSWFKEFKIENFTELHGGLDPRQRVNVQKRIKNMEFKWIIASDVAARGIDIDGVSHVISINLPNDLSYYIHRSGRTGRNKYEGISYVLHNSDNEDKILKLKAKQIVFTNYKLADGKLIKVEQKIKKPPKENTKLANETNKIINKYKSKKLKPGYKKKRKLEIDIIKRQLKRKHIKESIERIKKARYKKRRDELFDDE